MRMEKILFSLTFLDSSFSLCVLPQPFLPRYIKNILIIYMAGVAGFEPTTRRFEVYSSAVELHP